MVCPRISIIIPAYNASGFLPRLLHSILRQDYQDYEVIIINDGSSDETLRIASDFENKHNKIHVLNKSNGGVSSARNCGIEKARGEWIYFCDADDELADGALKVFSDLTGDTVGMIEGEYIVYESATQEKHQPFSKKKAGSESLSPGEMIRELFHPADGRYHGYLWTKLFRGDTIRLNNLRFNEEIKYNEDRLFIMQYLVESLKDKEIIRTWIPVYHYYVNPDSAMNSLGSRNYRNFFTDLKAYKECYYLAESVNLRDMLSLIKRLTAYSYLKNKALIDKYSLCRKEDNKHLNEIVAPIISKLELEIYRLRLFFGRCKRALRARSN